MTSFSDLLRTVNDNFNKYTAACYWHRLVMDKENPSDYESPTIQTRVAQIARQLGSVSFSSPQGHLGLTPICVAAIKGNPAGISFLLNQKASLEEKDRTGKSAMQYLREYHPLLVPQFLPSAPQIIKELIESLPKVHLSNAPCLYKEKTDDFGVIIKKLLFTKPYSGTSEEQKGHLETGIRVKNCAYNLMSVCEKLGINLETLSSYFMVRDHLIGLADGSLVFPKGSPSVKKAIERNESLKLVQKKSSSYLTPHEYFMILPGVVNDLNQHAVAEAFQKLDSIPSLPFYMEGGNHYLVSANSQLKLIIGEDVLQVAHLQFRLEKVFDDPKLGIATMTKLAAPRLTDIKIMRTIQEMYAQGLIKHPIDKKKGFISEEEILKASLQIASRGAVDFLQTVESLGYFTRLELNDKQIQAHRTIAAKYLAQKAMTKAILVKTFSLKAAEDIIIIPQMDYHLDNFMRPGPKESFFVQDYRYTVALLKKIKSQAEALQFTGKDMQMLERYLRAAQELDSHLKPLFDKTKERLLEAGFTVIPTPGIFYDISPRILSPDFPPDAITYNLNFMNGISGFSTVTKRHFYITTGAQVGDQLGKFIMLAFKEFLGSYIEDIDVFYVGHHPDNPGNFDEIMRWNNVLGAQFGIHCLSKVTETEAHKG